MASGISVTLLQWPNEIRLSQTKSPNLRLQRKVAPFVAVEMSFSLEKELPATDHFRGRKDFRPVDPLGGLSFLIRLSEPRFAQNHSFSVSGLARCDSNPRAASGARVQSAA